MAANKKLNIQPIAVPTAIGNLLNCAVTSLAGPVGFTMTQPYVLLKWIRIVNYAATATIVTLYKGVTGGNAAGTQFGAPAYSIPANSFIDIYAADFRLDSGDFLTGIASQAGIILNIAAEIGLS
jgi:hypothetical protein